MLTIKGAPVTSNHLSEPESVFANHKFPLHLPVVLVDGQPALPEEEPAAQARQLPHQHVADVPAGWRAAVVVPEMNHPDGPQALRRTVRKGRWTHSVNDNPTCIQRTEKWSFWWKCVGSWTDGCRNLWGKLGVNICFACFVHIEMWGAVQEARSQWPSLHWPAEKN